MDDITLLVIVVVVFIYGLICGLAFSLRKYCPRCGTPEPFFRIPKNWDQFINKGWTCKKCGAEVARFGKLVKKN